MLSNLRQWADNWSKFITAITIIGSAIITSIYFVTQPIIGWVKQIDANQELLLDLTSTNAASIAALNISMDQLTQTLKTTSDPAISFATHGNRISNGAIGGTVDLTWRFTKLRDCGRPRLAVFFRNGGNRVHRFQNVSIMGDTDRGVAVQPSNSIQSISYTAEIPDNEGVQVTTNHDFAYGWVVIDYPDLCPTVPVVVSPEVPFQILPN